MNRFGEADGAAADQQRTNPRIPSWLSGHGSHPIANHRHAPSYHALGTALVSEEGRRSPRWLTSSAFEHGSSSACTGDSGMAMVAPSPPSSPPLKIDWGVREDGGVGGNGGTEGAAVEDNNKHDVVEELDLSLHL